MPEQFNPMSANFDPVLFYKLLADPARLITLALIQSEGELCVCELMVALAETSQPKVSRNLALLRKQQLLLDRKQQQWVFYRLNPALPAWQQQVLTANLTHFSPYLAASLTRLQQMGNRPERRQRCCS